MYNQYGVELLPKYSLTPVTMDELRASIAEVQDVLDELTIISHGTYLKTDTDRDSRLENSRLWPDIAYMWDYAENGIYHKKFFSTHPDDFFSDAARILSAINGYNSWHGEEFGQPIVKVIIKFCARIKLDFDSDFDARMDTPFQDVVTLQSGWFPQLAMKDLTLLELALLAGMTNVRSVRNAQRANGARLNFYKFGLQVLVTVADARAWLPGRKGFVPSTNLPTAEGVVH